MTHDPIFTHDLIPWPATVASKTFRVLGLASQRGADLTVRAWRRPCCVQRCFLRHVSGSSFREKSFRKKKQVAIAQRLPTAIDVQSCLRGFFYNYHTFQVCFNLDMKFQARICWAFCLRGMSRTVSAVGGIQGSFTQQKKRSLTQNQWISSPVCGVFGLVWLGFCCILRFGWNKS